MAKHITLDDMVLGVSVTRTELESYLDQLERNERVSLVDLIFYFEQVLEARETE